MAHMANAERLLDVIGIHDRDADLVYLVYAPHDLRSGSYPVFNTAVLPHDEGKVLEHPAFLLQRLDLDSPDRIS